MSALSRHSSRHVENPACFRAFPVWMRRAEGRNGPNGEFFMRTIVMLPMKVLRLDFIMWGLARVIFTWRFFISSECPGMTWTPVFEFWKFRVLIPVPYFFYLPFLSFFTAHQNFKVTWYIKTSRAFIHSTSCIGYHIFIHHHNPNPSPLQYPKLPNFQTSILFTSNK